MEDYIKRRKPRKLKSETRKELKGISDKGRNNERKKGNGERKGKEN